MTRTIHCTVIEVPVMAHSRGVHNDGGFEELLPWADPYIAALMEKLRNSAEYADGVDGDIDCELPPPLENGDSSREPSWPSDWGHRHGLLDD